MWFRSRRKEKSAQKSDYEGKKREKEKLDQSHHKVNRLLSRAVSYTHLDVYKRQTEHSAVHYKQGRDALHLIQSRDANFHLPYVSFYTLIKISVISLS